MKLKEHFKKLASTAFGSWLAAFQKLFSNEELEAKILNIKQKAPEKLEVNKKDLVILSNKCY
ncbi:hypothetical protein [Candidatus Rickettsia kedanie]|uniref:Uncharacterized protein n=1 Tax=Candidatus Rickettsia kedanie TaxID=3115352 RepID=A0ABP9TV06_9RICK